MGRKHKHKKVKKQSTVLGGWGGGLYDGYGGGYDGDWDNWEDEPYMTNYHKAIKTKQKKTESRFKICPVESLEKSK